MPGRPPHLLRSGAGINVGANTVLRLWAVILFVIWCWTTLLTKELHDFIYHINENICFFLSFRSNCMRLSNLKQWLVQDEGIDCHHQGLMWWAMLLHIFPQNKDALSSPTADYNWTWPTLWVWILLVASFITLTPNDGDSLWNTGYQLLTADNLRRPDYANPI
jgi:hypothetical protein